MADCFTFWTGAPSTSSISPRLGGLRQRAARSCHLGRNTQLAGWLLVCRSFHCLSLDAGFKAGALLIRGISAKSHFRGTSRVIRGYRSWYWSQVCLEGKIIPSDGRCHPVPGWVSLGGGINSIRPWPGRPEGLILHGETKVLDGRQQRETSRESRPLARPDAGPVLVCVLRLVIRKGPTAPPR